jgi:hypothetical protein
MPWKCKPQAVKISANAVGNLGDLDRLSFFSFHFTDTARNGKMKRISEKRNEN